MATKLGAPDRLLANALVFPRWIDNRQFAAVVAETYTVPTGVNLILFVAQGANFWVNTQAVAAAPAGDVTDGTASAFIPQNSALLIEVDEGASLSIIPDAAVACNANLWGYSRKKI